ncbi:uncharacterized protein L201_004175 [Kwoniella dendrophila CBS 6074]|uniref:Uncharacterized protein n=1 Tax=Kwoniella dendrophila CBS 6074 TaxID=1295534 RepID=A0AAX4JWI9_9TREE
MLHDLDNTSLEIEFNVLALNLRDMWYQHGYTGLRYFKQHIADIYKRFQILLDEDKVDAETLRAAENACNELLALSASAVPDETWLPYVTSMKKGILISSSGSGGSSLSLSPNTSPQNSPTEEKNLSHNHYDYNQNHLYDDRFTFSNRHRRFTN